MRGRPTCKLRPEVERFEARCLLSVGSPRSPFATGASRLVRAPRPTTQHFPVKPQPTAFDLVPDNGALAPIVEQVQVDSVKLTPGVYNVAILAVRNGTGHSIEPRTFSVNVPGSTGPKAFPANNRWNAGGVILFYAISKGKIGPNFSFNLGWTQIDRPTNTYSDIRYINAASFSTTLNSLISPRNPGGRYRLV